MIDVVVVGAGIAGLTCAQRIADSGRKVRVVEATDHVGGMIRSVRCDDYLLERGPNTIQKSSPQTEGIIDRLGLGHRVVEAGADEVDMVISRGRFLAGEYGAIFDEVAATVEACGSAHLKVILETGELQTLDNVRLASQIAIDAGAHFIKTSTGKVSPAATMPVTLVMLEVIREDVTRVLMTAQLRMQAPPPPVELPELPEFLTGHIDPFFGTDDADSSSRPTGAEAILGALAGAPRATAGAGGAEGERNPYAGMDVSRNAPCPCGSGQKYKHCHGAA